MCFLVFGIPEDGTKSRNPIILTTICIQFQKEGIFESFVR
jgi:hypothetical protein